MQTGLPSILTLRKELRPTDPGGQEPFILKESVSLGSQGDILHRDTYKNSILSSLVKNFHPDDFWKPKVQNKFYFKTVNCESTEALAKQLRNPLGQSWCLWKLLLLKGQLPLSDLKNKNPKPHLSGEELTQHKHGSHSHRLNLKHFNSSLCNETAPHTALIWTGLELSSEPRMAWNVL